MKKFSIITTMILPLALFSGCMKNEIVNEETGAVEIQFKAEDRATNRAAIGSEGFPVGSAFSVWGYMTNESQTANVFEGNSVTKGADDYWNCDATRYWIPGWNYDFYAVYPAKDQLPTGTSANVEIDEESGNTIFTVTNFDCSATGDNVVDLMTATANVPYSEGAPVPESANLTFQHLLSKVSIIGNSEGSDAYITSISLTNVNTKGTYTYVNNVGQWGESSSNTITSNEGFNLPSTPTDIFGDLLLIPQSVDNIQLNITYNYPGIIDPETDEPLEKSIVYDLPTTYDWEIGKSYRYSFTLIGDYIIFEVPQVNSWNEASGGIIIVD